MKATALLLATSCLLFSVNISNAQEPSPGQRLQNRILEVELESLIDVYADVFRDMQNLRTGALRLELEEREENAEEIKREAYRIKRGMKLLDRRLHELREEMESRVHRMEELRQEIDRRREEGMHRNREQMEEERHRNMEQRGRMEGNRMNEERRRNFEQPGGIERERMEGFHRREMEERENMEREHVQRREREIHVERQERRGRVERGNSSEGNEAEHEVEVKVFVDGREVDVEIDDDHREEK